LKNSSRSNIFYFSEKNSWFYLYLNRVVIFRDNFPVFVSYSGIKSRKMAPYLRFPEREAISQRFWGCQPRNPTCGKISWEKGAKIYAWANMIFAAAAAILSVLLFLIIFVHIHGASSSTHQEIMKSLKEGTLQKQNGEWVEKIYSQRNVSLIQFLLFSSFIYFSLCWFIGWKLKKSIVERDLPNLKKYYIVMLSLTIFSIILSLWETEEVVWSKAFLVDIPVYILNFMGLMFTHGFIASLIEDPSQPEDMNRIQFNPWTSLIAKNYHIINHIITWW